MGSLKVNTDIKHTFAKIIKNRKKWQLKSGNKIQILGQIGVENW